MDHRIARIATSQGLVFRRAQALEAGFSDEEIRALLRSGRWRRVRRGSYTDAEVFDPLDEVGRHRLRAYAAALTLKGPVVFGHVTAAAFWGIPLWNAPLDDVNVYRAEPQVARREAQVRHLTAALPDDDIVEVNGVLVTKPGRTILDLSRDLNFEAGVVAADGALHMNLTDPDELRRYLETQRDWPGARTAGAVVSFADGLAETPGESRSRVLFAGLGLPSPELQVEFRDSDGVVFARTDFLLPEQRTVAEYDGKVKYKIGSAMTREDAERILIAEKRREDLIREEGYEVVRLISEDLYQRRRTANRMRAAFLRAVSRYGRPTRLAI